MTITQHETPEQAVEQVQPNPGTAGTTFLVRTAVILGLYGALALAFRFAPVGFYYPTVLSVFALVASAPHALEWIQKRTTGKAVNHLWLKRATLPLPIIAWFLFVSLCPEQAWTLGERGGVDLLGAEG